MCDAAYLSNVSLHNTNRINQDISGQSLNLLSESSAEQKGCKKTPTYYELENKTKHFESCYSRKLNIVLLLMKPTYSVCQGGHG